MVASTLESLLVVALAVLPGAAYTLSYERVVGSFGVGFSDRLVRFLAVSALFHAAVAGLTYTVYARQVVSGDLVAGRASAIEVELLALLYVALPTAAGLLVGVGTKRNWSWAQWVVGQAPEPRAWDHLWSSDPAGVVRMRLKSGVWLGASLDQRADGRHSYAAGYPEPGDLWFAQTLAVDPDSGDWLQGDDGRPIVSDTGILVRWDEVEYLELREVDDG